MPFSRVRVNTKSKLGVGVAGGSGVAVGGRGVAVTVGGSGDGVLEGNDVWVGDGVAVGGNGVGVGGNGVGVAVSTGVAVRVGTGMRVGVGNGVDVGVASGPQPASTPDKMAATARIPMRLHAPAKRWAPLEDNITLTRITFPLYPVSVIMQPT